MILLGFVYWSYLVARSVLYTHSLPSPDLSHRRRRHHHHCHHHLSLVRSFWQTVFQHVVRLLYNLKTIKWEKMTMPFALLPSPPPTRMTSVTPFVAPSTHIHIYCYAYTISEYHNCVKSLSPVRSCNCNMLRA